MYLFILNYLLLNFYDMNIQILVDNPNSWIIPFAKNITEILMNKGHQCDFIIEHKDVKKGDILFLLGCEKIFKKLNYNKYNLVVHESDLPNGKGWSPLTWQILEGKSKIPITLFEAVESIDGGEIYRQEIIKLNGTELLPEIKEKQGLATQKLILDFVEEYPDVKGKKQEGDSTFYKRRRPKDSELDPYKTLEEQFELLRVCDNERYPAYFIYRNKKYVIKIFKDND